MFNNSELKKIQPNIRSYVCSIVYNPKDCQDIIQEINLKILSNRDKFDNSKKLLPWAITISSFQIKKYLQNKKRWNRRYVNFDHVYFLAIDDPMNKLVEHEKKELDQNLSEFLSKRQYSIYKYLCKGYTVDGISKKMSITPMKVSRSKSAMIENVRKFLRENLNFKIK